MSVSVKAPRQENSYDCGVYILKFADVILDNYYRSHEAFADDGPISNDVIEGRLDMLITSRAFAAEDIREARTHIQKCISDDAVRYQQALTEQKQQKRESASITAAVGGGGGAETPAETSFPLPVESTWNSAAKELEGTRESEGADEAKESVHELVPN